MVGLLRNYPLLRALTLFTIATFLPSAAGAWNFVDAHTVSPPSSDVSSNPWSELPWIISEVSGDASFLPWAKAGSPLPFNTDLRLLAESELGAIKGGQAESAQEGLANAHELYNQGRVANGCLAFLDLIDKHPRTLESVEANRMLTEASERLMRGEVSRSELDQFEANLPSFDQQTSPDGKYIVLDFHRVKGRLLASSGDAKGSAALYELLYNEARNLLVNYPANPLQIDTVLILMESARATQQTPDTVAFMEEFCRSTAPCMSTFAAHYVCAAYTNQEINAQARSVDHYRAILVEADQALVKDALADPTVYPWVKAYIEMALADAQHATGDVLGALRGYEHIVASYPDSGEPIHEAAYNIAFIKGYSQGNPYEGIAAFQKLVQQYPGGVFAMKALLQIGNLYQVAEDYDTARNVFKEVISAYPDSIVAITARYNADYIDANLQGATQVADGYIYAQADTSSPNDTKLAQLCGPKALQALLKFKNIDATVNDLAVAARTDDKGTTMLGLLKAARTKGVRLVGVHAAEARALTT